MSAEYLAHSQFGEAIPQNMLLRTFSTSSLGRGKSKHSSFRYSSDSSFPWDFRVFPWTASFRQTSLLLLRLMLTALFPSPVSGPGTRTWRIYAITTWFYKKKSLCVSSEATEVFYKSTTFVLTPILYNCFIFPGCKTSSFQFWFSDFHVHHFKISALSSYHPHRWLTSMHGKFKVTNNQSNCCSFSYCTWNLPRVLSKICSTSSLSSEAARSFTS